MTIKCSIDNCEIVAHAKGWCRKHYTRWYNYGDPSIVKNGNNVCGVNGCTNKYYSTGYCKTHYQHFYRHGDPNLTLKAPAGTGYINQHGYREIRVNGEKILEHRYVMEQYLGRRLFGDENVHHKNGDRLDNRLENLELWSKVQPAGKRVEDLVNYAIEIINRYGKNKENLADEVAKLM